MARYEITHNKIFDDSGNLRFTVRRNRNICDPSGYELAAFDEHPFRLQVDVTRNGYVVASVHPPHLGIGKHYTIDSPAGQFNASGHFFSHGYELTGPGGDRVALVTQQHGFRERFDVEIAPGQDDVLLLAVILAIEDIRNRPPSTYSTPTI
ncbi:MAG TPA: hypothetical protein VII22_28480 [Streptosporangiaceae bacterium]